MGRRLTVLFLVVVAVSSATAGGSAPASHLEGQVVDERTGEPVLQAWVRAGAAWAAVDGAGRFRLDLPDGARHLRISAMGYDSTVVVLPAAAPLRVRLVPVALRVSDTVLITARADTTRRRSRAPTTTEAALAQAPAIDLVRRGVFAPAPAVRGQQGSRVDVRIDGMHMAPACVDGMDPVTAYVEVENLQRLDIVRGAFDLTRGAGLAGSIDLVTETADPDVGAGGWVRLGFDAASRRRSLRAVGHRSIGATATRASVSWQGAGDLRAGAGRTVAGSGYTKVNAKVDAARRWGRAHRVDVGVLADRAWDMGFPVLLMDARRAQSSLWSAAHTWSSAGTAVLRSRLYHTRVDHWMDDDDRDVERRRVMTGMRMPMYGRSRTWGWRQELEARHDERRVRLVLDAYHATAFADMWMHSTTPAVSPMYLVNLGDARTTQATLAASVEQPWARALRLRLDLRLEAAASDLTSDLGRRQVEARVTAADLARRDLLPGGAAVLSWRPAQSTTLHAAVAHTARRPSHIERYGFYLYDVGQAAFVDGDPHLHPEQATQVQVGADYRGARLGLTLRLHHQWIANHIAAAGDHFRTFANRGDATLSGVEARAWWRLSHAVEATTTTTWTRGHNDNLDEPLREVPPLGGMLHLTATHTWGWTSVTGHWAAPQRRVAWRTTVEDETEGWAVLDIEGALRLAEGARLTVAVDNVLDRRYHEHLSVGNLPAAGRNLRLAVRFER